MAPRGLGAPAGQLLNRPPGSQVRLQSRETAVTAHSINYLETDNSILPQPARALADEFNEDTTIQWPSEPA